MKSTIVTIMLITLFTIYQNIGSAQNLTPTQGTITHNDKSRPCLSVNLDPEPKTLKKAWKNYLKDNYDFKLKGIGFLSNKDLLSAEEVVVLKISDKAMDFYTEIVEDEMGSQMKVFASHGYDLYISPTETPREFEALKTILTTFLETYIPNYYEELVEDSEDVVKDLTKDKEKLNKSIAKDKKNIDKMTSKIEKLTQEITDNKLELIKVEEKLSNRTIKLEKYKAKLQNVTK